MNKKLGESHEDQISVCNTVLPIPVTTPQMEAHSISSLVLSSAVRGVEGQDYVLSPAYDTSQPDFEASPPYPHHRTNVRMYGKRVVSTHA